MFEMNVPYDKGQMKIKLEDKNLAGVLEGRQSDYKTTLSENEIVEQSLNNPIGSKSLEELAKGKKNIVIISSDHTRPVPSKIITPILLRRIRSVSPDARIRILVATGFHRPSTHEELVAKYGEDIVKNEEIVMHVSTDDSSMVKIGQLPSGGDCIINKVAAEADLLISEGFIEAHFFAGFSGGRKSVLPGIASYKTRLCHNKQLINSHFYRGVSELPYKLLFAVIYTHLEFRYEVSHTITSHHVHHFHQTRIPDGTLLDYMVQYRKPLFPQFFLYPKKFLPENNPHHKEFHLRPYIQNNANQ